MRSVPAADDDDGTLDPEGERRLGALVREGLHDGATGTAGGAASGSVGAGHEGGHEFVFVTDFPVIARPFYHLRPVGPTGEPTGVTASFDLLWNGPEVTTGAQREHRHDRLVAQAVEAGVDPRAPGLRAYLDCFRFGCPPHGGFGVGLARLLMRLLDLLSIREATFLFRGPNRLSP